MADQISDALQQALETVLSNIQNEMVRRSTAASEVLLDAKTLVFRGRRSGHRYRVPGTRRFYTASAPGEVPAARTGNFRTSWKKKVTVVKSGDNRDIHIGIVNEVKTQSGNYLLGEILENGTRKMAPRPYQQKILDRAEPKIIKIYAADYLRGDSK